MSETEPQHSLEPSEPDTSSVEDLLRRALEPYVSIESSQTDELFPGDSPDEPKSE